LYFIFIYFVYYYFMLKDILLELCGGGTDIIYYIFYWGTAKRYTAMHGKWILLRDIVGMYIFYLALP